MPRGNTKAQCAAYEKRMAAALTEAFGPAKDDHSGEKRVWTFERPDGVVEITLGLDSQEPGHGYRSRDLFCRHSASGTERPFGSNGKHNLHVPEDWDLRVAFNSSIFHIMKMAVRDTPPWTAIGDVELIPMPDETFEDA